MANIKSAKKRMRTSEKNRLANVQVKSAVRTATKKLVRTLDSKETVTKEVAQPLLVNFEKTIDSAASKGVFHWKTAARRKSRLAKRVNKITAL